MTSSMTAFARRSVQKNWGTATLELRSLNHRYLELDFRLPDTLRELEGAMRAQAIEYVHRGKLECQLKYKPTELSGEQWVINHSVLTQLIQANAQISECWQGRLSTSLMEILNWPGVLQVREMDKTLLQEDIQLLFKEALEDVIAMRQREGDALEKRVKQRLQQVLAEVDVIKQRLPMVMKLYRQKILLRIEEFDLTINPQRLEEELLMLMQKMDISEEVERLEIHVGEVQATLKLTGSIGRRLDFLMQELHRESNTLGAKSLDPELAHSAIHLKVLVEQMREQVQNIE